MRASIVLVISAGLLVSACDRSADVQHSTPATPQQYAFASADEAWKVLRETSQGMVGRCGTFPRAIAGEEEGSTGQLSCLNFRVSPSQGHWLLNLFTYSDDFYAEAGYRKECADIPHSKTDGWW
jgi:hypothetical protein